LEEGTEHGGRKYRTGKETKRKKYSIEDAIKERNKRGKMAEGKNKRRKKINNVK
jgi:hypothetical protein